ncbi:hypothetical protein FNV43_RR18569 [Rhamnella rubrinervis]|uniref:Transmembrane protein n=1 Tax=Rhamnella rubrinervis TaxID=2594499 RepID=A0A8K0DZM1_9ROSA|nr:hypothetical protein FNV43_RR18569 [Rhamnella rubrinervis]
MPCVTQTQIIDLMMMCILSPLCVGWMMIDICSISLDLFTHDKRLSDDPSLLRLGTPMSLSRSIRRCGGRHEGVAIVIEVAASSSCSSGFVVIILSCFIVQCGRGIVSLVCVLLLLLSWSRLHTGVVVLSSGSLPCYLIVVVFMVMVEALLLGCGCDYRLVHYHGLLWSWHIVVVKVTDNESSCRGVIVNLIFIIIIRLCNFVVVGLLSKVMVVGL